MKRETHLIWTIPLIRKRKTQNTKRKISKEKCEIENGKCPMPVHANEVTKLRLVISTRSCFIISRGGIYITLIAE